MGITITRTTYTSIGEKTVPEPLNKSNISRNEDLISESLDRISKRNEDAERRIKRLAAMIKEKEKKKKDSN